MGNKFCKKKVDGVASAAGNKTPSQFDRIINRLHIRPSAWKSETHLNQKQINRCEISSPQQQLDKQNNIIKTRPLSKSSDWTEVDLEVPEKEEQIHLRNPRLSIIFNNENGTPTPPPRKQKRNFREKIEAVAKSGLQAFQPKKPVEEVLCVKKTINYKCPLCDQDEHDHNRDHHHHNHKEKTKDKNENINDNQENHSQNEKDAIKRKKNLSVISLPNYDELKLTVANFDDIDKGPVSLKLDDDKRKISELSLPADPKKSTSGSSGKLDAYITRCRSFGSLLPQHFKKIRGARKVPTEIESDDSFGGLEDWDLGLLEHYNPKDASLPRPRKAERSSKDVISDLESMIVHEEDIEKPIPPVRRSESLVKKINREAAQSAHEVSSEQLDNNNIGSLNRTPPPSPIHQRISEQRLSRTSLPTEENVLVEHSSLLKILENFSIRDKLINEENKKTVGNSIKANISSNESSLTPSLVEFEKNIPVNSIEDFLTAEKINTERDINAKLKQVIVA
ncbi:unnamed protein product [Phaedon cochleariae]|uniref:Uncharacterized protein n=1 Tax=Phaedon cochleariae TaxID=80249 RepID=A0A9P0GS34_PHACE|nr:unnamed protein product [Phaedon cochleariae]